MCTERCHYTRSIIFRTHHAFRVNNMPKPDTERSKINMANRVRKLSTDESNLTEKRHRPNTVKMFCWGSTIHGELGLGGIEDENIFLPRKVDFIEAGNIEQIACGENYTVVITKEGKVYSCGNNDYGQLGHEKARKRLQLIPGLEAFAFKKIACGNCHTLAVNEWGQLFGWGNDELGQLGLDNGQTQRVPRMIKAMGTRVVVQIACGKEHSVALTNDGELYAWGSNKEGQLGISEDISIEKKPRLISSLAAVPIAFIACGGYHTIAITKSGAVFAWGRNTFGQLGLNDTKQRNFPCKLHTLRNTKLCYTACGEEFSVFLTRSGGVFTCGAGMYGQLGHGGTINELLPRQIVELMDSTVTQISCGKKHTLALVPSRGKVYAWGLGGAGQLGNRASRSATTPQVVLGPWSSQNGSSMLIDSYHTSQSDCVVKHIFSGGDHCFATTVSRKDNIEPDDCRILGSTSQILTVTQEKIADFHKFPLGATISHDVMTYIETVFRSQACINASCLLANDAHYGCSINHHGVDIDYAIKLFGSLSEVDNTTIQELIFVCVTQNLIPSFTVSPSDVESLRVYLILPLYHRFAKVSNHSSLQIPFGKAMMRLHSEALNIIYTWWTVIPSYYYERLVRIYKSIVMDIVSQTKNKRISWNDNLHCVLQLLKILYDKNKTTVNETDLIVPYETFYLRELPEHIDLSEDYFRWISVERLPVHYCDYAFLFDGETKATLLETDQSIQMQSAMTEAASRAFRDMMFGVPNQNAQQYNQFIVLNVSREDIVADTLSQLRQYQSSELKKPLRVKFFGEEAEDVGGVKKEFFLLLLREVLDPKYGMFKEYEETKAIWFNTDSLEDQAMYFLIGVLCGLAIYNFTIIDLPFPLALYKKLLEEPVGLNDIKGLSPVMANSLRSILDYNEEDLEEVFCLNFEIVREAFGEQITVELLPNGKEIPVTLTNKQQYVNLYVDYILNKSVEPHFTSFSKGFLKVCGGRILKLFHSQELMALLIGNQNYDWEELERNASYKEGYTKNDPTIVLFWQVFHELSLEDKKKFLLFLTGSDRIPIWGMKAIKIIIQPMTDERFLPAAHTCFNLLDLPRYQTKEKLRYKLLQAIQHNEGFSLV